MLKIADVKLRDLIGLGMLLLFLEAMVDVVLIRLF